MSKPCTRREEVYLSFKRLDDGVQTLWARRYGGIRFQAAQWRCGSLP